MSGNPNMQKMGKRKTATGQKQPDWLFPSTGIVAPNKANNDGQSKNKDEKDLAKELLRRRAAGKTPKSATLTELTELIGTFLVDNEFTNTNQAFRSECKKRGEKAETVRGLPSLSTIYNEWRQLKDEKKTTAGVKNEYSRENLAADQSLNANERSRSEGSESSEGSEDSDIEMVDATQVKKFTAKASRSSSSSSSSSDSDTDEEGDEVQVSIAKLTQPRANVNGLKRKASSGSDSSSSSTSESSSEEEEGEAPKAKKLKAQAAPSSSESESGSESDSEVEVASEKLQSAYRASATPKPKKVKTISISSESESSSSSSGSESDSDDESDSSTNSVAQKVPLPTSDSESSDSESKSDEATPKITEKPISSDTSATLSDAPLKLSVDPSSDSSSSDSDSQSNSKPTTKAPATKTAVRKLSPPLPPTPAFKQKKTNVPFSRIPKDIKVDDRLASNAYIPYDYAQKAHEDLIVTRGKGFTKEKNKKKRGSYRGGYIDVEGKKGIKFED